MKAGVSFGLPDVLLLGSDSAKAATKSSCIRIRVARQDQKIAALLEPSVISG